jgi:chromate transport protein ChrA
MSWQSGPLEGDLARISEKCIARTVSVLSTIIAVILLIGAVIKLYLVTNNNVRLILVAVYTMVFAATVGLLTSASRAEGYASTAAYAACLGVFVSGNLGGPESGF